MNQGVAGITQVTSAAPARISRPVRAALGVDALIVQPQSLDRFAANQVFRDDRFGILRLYTAIPNCLRVNHNCGPVLALVQAAGFVDAHPAAQAGGFGKLLQLRKQLARAIAGARGPRSTLGTNILTDKHMTFKRGQNEKSSKSHAIGA